jgi:hypothetical protein
MPSAAAGEEVSEECISAGSETCHFFNNTSPALPVLKRRLSLFLLEARGICRFLSYWNQIRAAGEKKQRRFKARCNPPAWAVAQKKNAAAAGSPAGRKISVILFALRNFNKSDVGKLPAENQLTRPWF